PERRPGGHELLVGKGPDPDVRCGVRAALAGGDPKLVALHAVGPVGLGGPLVTFTVTFSLPSLVNSRVDPGWIAPLTACQAPTIRSPLFASAAGAAARHPARQAARAKPGVLIETSWGRGGYEREEILAPGEREDKVGRPGIAPRVRGKVTGRA